ncbi:MAG: hypothetical protein ACSHXK_05685 [Oceanococcus sp.]
MNNSSIFVLLGLSLFAVFAPAMGQDRAETAAGIRAGYAAAVQTIQRQLLDDVDCQMKQSRLDFMLQSVDGARSQQGRIMMCENPAQEPDPTAG